MYKESRKTREIKEVRLKAEVREGGRSHTAGFEGGRRRRKARADSHAAEADRDEEGDFSIKPLEGMQSWTL